RGSEHVRKYLGRRRQNGTDVMIAVVTPPPEGGNNELSHYAADVKLLAETPHPHVVQVMEARWVGTNALAVVSERVRGQALADVLDHGEHFSNPRVAAVLHEVFGVL